MQEVVTPLYPSVNIELSDNTFFEQLRHLEYATLDEQHQTYLDFTGGNLYAASQIKAHAQFLLNNTLGNPHSTNPTSKLATILVENTRAAVLQFFNANDYHCIFTANASGALKIVGESYPFNEKSTFMLLSDNHNSVNGIREFCKSKGGNTVYVPVQHHDFEINAAFLQSELASIPSANNNLFAFPAQSNVSGVKHNLEWIEYAQTQGFDVLLDAAAFVPSSKLDLSVYKPDFVAVSFYKIFGYPTGIGCLLVKKSSFSKLIKPWFAGGTVSLVAVQSQNKFLADGPERFEDGTLNYNMIPAVAIGLEYINKIGIDNITRRVVSLAEYLAAGLKNLTHSNGTQLVKIFGPETFEHRGGTLIMNFFDIHGAPFTFEEVEQLANQHNISIRTGCFCNPGIDEINNNINADELSGFFLQHDKGNYHDIMHYLGKLRGAARVSVGIASVQRDLDTFIRFACTLLNKTAISNPI